MKRSITIMHEMYYIDKMNNIRQQIRKKRHVHVTHSPASKQKRERHSRRI